MVIKCKFIELHTPLFLAGTNLGTKLDISKRTTVTLAYHKDIDLVVVNYNEGMALIPLSNVVSMWPIDHKCLLQAADEARTIPLACNKVNPCKPN